MSESLKPPHEKPQESTEWVERTPLLLPKDFFELQFRFATILHERTGTPLINCIRSSASMIANYIPSLRQEDNGKVSSDVEPENIVDVAYTEYLCKHKDKKPIPYHEIGGTRYGCCYYAYEKDSDSVSIHFSNAEFDPNSGPLDPKKVVQRLNEFTEVLLHIRKAHPDLHKLEGVSWLFNLPIFKDIFPISLIDLQVDENKAHWRRGMTIWGQFLGSDYSVRKVLSKALLKEVQKMTPGSYLSDIFKEGSPILPPLRAEGLLQNFYTHFGIKE